MTEINTTNVQPLAFVHNNEVIYVEENTQNVQKKFSCFKIFKLKGPIDVNYLLNVIFPPSERDYYDLEVSEYNGKSAKVKFNFIDKSHTDLIQRLQDSAAKVFDISENGLIDWLASDTITFRTIYQNTDLAANHQIHIDNALSYNAQDDIFNNYATSSSSSSSSSPSSISNLQLYPVIDEKAIEQELNELSKRVSSQTNLKTYELERLLHNTFQRRDMTITISDLSDEYFSQIRDVVAFIGSGVPSSLIDDNMMLDSNTVFRNFARYLFKHTESFINSRNGVVIGFVKDYKFGVILTLWNLINAFHSIHVSYQVLIETDDAFRKILKSQKPDFMKYLSNMDKTLMDLIIILHEEIDQQKYERLQLRLEFFVKASEDLMKLVMIINNKCNAEIERLEDQEKALTNKLLAAAITIGISAIAIGGYIYNNKKKRSYAEYEKWIGGAVTCVAVTTTTTAMVQGYTTKTKLQSAIQQQTNILNQLQSAYKELRSWKNLGNKYIERDINDMNNNRMTLLDEFIRIRSQCKCLGEIFDLLDDGRKIEERKRIF